MKNKTKTGILIIVLLLAVGFAAVSTSLLINGTANFGTNTDEFEVIFTQSVIDGVDVTESTISEDGKTLTFTTSELAIMNDVSKLDFVVTNNSKQYDASVTMECVTNGEHANTYYKVEHDLPDVVNASSKKSGIITVTLLKTSVESIEETFTCTITASAQERDSIALEQPTLYNLIASEADKTTAIDFSLTSSASGTNGIYTTTNTDSGKEVYYYRGNVDNNIVFADFCWKIIRTTETGGVKLIYNGIPAEDGSCNNTAEASAIGTSAFNSVSDDNAYIGYMYGTPNSNSYAETHANENESRVKKYSIDPWYKENIEDKGYTKYLEDTVFCNDRNITPYDSSIIGGTDYNSATTLGYGKNITMYGVASRAWYWTLKPNPSLVCKNTQGSVPEDHDSFTVSKKNGNGKLTYPVGMITLDEIVLSGYNSYASNPSNHNETNNYLYIGKYFMTMSPGNYSVLGSGYVAIGHALSHIGTGNASQAIWIRPVISLTRDIQVSLSGDGSIETPYEVVEY